MSYFPVGHRVTGGEIDDFDDYDTTHYAGGYDIDLTYGRSLPPSFETCYPYRSSASNYPQFASHSKPSAYAVEALGNQYNSFSGHSASADGSVYSGPKPNYGFQPGGGVSEHGGRNEYARREPGYGSGYGVKPPSSKSGSSHGRSSEYENPNLIHDKPGRKPDYGESGYGPGVRNPASGFGGSRYESGGPGYGGWEKPTYPKPSYPEPSYPIPSYPEPSYPIPSYPEPSYPIPSYPEPSYPIPSSPEPSYPMPSYPDPSYPTPGHGLQKHEHDHSDHERRKHHQSHRHGHHQ